MRHILTAAGIILAACGVAAAQSTLPENQQPGAFCDQTQMAMPCPAVPSPGIDNSTTSSVPGATTPSAPDATQPRVVPNDPLNQGNGMRSGNMIGGNSSISRPSGGTVTSPSIR
jgi:hypothetical protein